MNKHDKKRVHGSILKKIVATDLQEEREKCDFDQTELRKVYWTNKQTEALRDQICKDVEEDPALAFSHKIYEQTREEN